MPADGMVAPRYISDGKFGTFRSNDSCQTIQICGRVGNGSTEPYNIRRTLSLTNCGREYGRWQNSFLRPCHAHAPTAIDLRAKPKQKNGPDAAGHSAETANLGG
jgi:hypothetical protein